MRIVSAACDRRSMVNDSKWERLCESDLMCYYFGVAGGAGMGRFIEGCDRRQKLLLPDCVDDFVSENSDLDQAEPAHFRHVPLETRFTR